jgi:Ni,Fe-hydrogenase I small subunit
MEQTNKQNETYLQSIERKGYSRRDFMKFVAFIGAYMGVESTALGVQNLGYYAKIACYLGAFSRMHLL